LRDSFSFFIDTHSKGRAHMKRIVSIVISLFLAAACTGSVAEKAESQVPAAAACLPGAVAKILAASAAGDNGAVVIAVAELVACWATHQPAAAHAAAATSRSLDSYHAELELEHQEQQDMFLSDIIFETSDKEFHEPIRVSVDADPDTFPAAAAEGIERLWRRVCRHQVTSRPAPSSASSAPDETGSADSSTTNCAGAAAPAAAAAAAAFFAGVPSPIVA
jgi:hypothetical protein